VRERSRTGQVIDRNDVDVIVCHGGAHDVAADSSETVDAYLDGHAGLLSTEGRQTQTSKC
jgi:hypothetical protein